MLEVHFFGTPAVGDLVEDDLDHLGVGPVDPSATALILLATWRNPAPVRRKHPMQDLLDLKAVCCLLGGTRPINPATLYRGVRLGRGRSNGVVCKEDCCDQDTWRLAAH